MSMFSDGRGVVVGVKIVVCLCSCLLLFGSDPWELNALSDVEASPSSLL